MNDPLVSVIIPCHNAGPWVAAAIGSVLEQTHGRVETIVVDDGSTDDSRRVVERFGERVRLASGPQRGGCAARNRGYLLSRGELIQYLDADDLLPSDKIATQVAALAGNSRAVAVSPFAFFAEDPTGAKPIEDPLVGHTDPADWLIAKYESGYANQTACWLTPRTVHEAAGHWDERLRMNQDGEFFNRVLLHAERVVSTPDTLVYYRCENTTSVSRRRDEAAAASRLLSHRLCEERLRARRDDQATRQSCQLLYLRFLRDYYPRHPELLEEALKRLESLGPGVKATGTPRSFRWATQTLGVRRALRLRNLVSRGSGKAP